MSVPKSFSTLCPLDFTNSVIGASDVKSEGKETPLYKPMALTTEQLQVIRAMAPAFASSKTVYSIRMTRAASLTSSGGGAMALATPVYPSQFDQYTQLSPLFSECRIRKVRMQLTCLPNPNAATVGTTDLIGGSFALAFNPRPGGTSPTTSITDVLRLPGCRVFNPFTNGRQVLVYKFPKVYPWSLTAGTGGGTDPIGGTSGFFCNVALNTITASRAYMLYLIEAEYEFRGLI